MAGKVGGGLLKPIKVFVSDVLLYLYGSFFTIFMVILDTWKTLHRWLLNKFQLEFSLTIASELTRLLPITKVSFCLNWRT